jgi:hypothetical protein
MRVPIVVDKVWEHGIKHSGILNRRKQSPKSIQNLLEPQLSVSRSLLNHWLLATLLIDQKATGGKDLRGQRAQIPDEMKASEVSSA